MIIKLQNLIDANKVADLTKSLSKDLAGKQSGPIIATSNSDRQGNDLRKEVSENMEFSSVSMVKALTDFTFCHLRQGMGYALPFDNPVIDPMGPRPVRADLWVTVFLNDASDYEGGDLVANSAGAVERVKLNAGDAVIYPATNFQTVSEVTKGARLTADAAIQCFVRGEDQRKILMEIHSVLNWMMSVPPDHKERLRAPIHSLRRARANLYRLWAET